MDPSKLPAAQNISGFAKHTEITDDFIFINKVLLSTFQKVMPEIFPPDIRSIVNLLQHVKYHIELGGHELLNA